MRSIMVINAKGGCGKSTLATNIAAWCASNPEITVSLADYDPQRSSLDWLALRARIQTDRPQIHALDAASEGLKHLDRRTNVLVIDAPARAHGPELTELVRHAHTIVLPVLPSPIDIYAATRFITELQEVGKVERREVKIGVVANRVKENTLIYNDLQLFLDQLKVPFLTTLRDAQNYIRAYSRGLGIHELPPYLAAPDWEQWAPLTNWLISKRSRPA